MNVSVSHYSSAGGRKINEDSTSVTRGENGFLAVVADGLGGMGNGDVASKLTVSTMWDVLSRGEITPERLEEAAQIANERIITERGDGKMCSTLAALWIGENKAYSCHSGDSRIYQIRNNKIIFQSKDHSVSQMAVLMGKITPAEIRGHKDRNKLVRSLGASGEAKAEINAITVEKGDAFVLCSDGFWELILEEEMIACLAYSANAVAWLNKMRSVIESRITATSDNYTAVTVIVQEAKRSFRDENKEDTEAPITVVVDKE